MVGDVAVYDRYQLTALGLPREVLEYAEIHFDALLWLWGPDELEIRLKLCRDIPIPTRDWNDAYNAYQRLRRLCELRNKLGAKQYLERSRDILRRYRHIKTWGRDWKWWHRATSKWIHHNYDRIRLDPDDLPEFPLNFCTHFLAILRP